MKTIRGTSGFTMNSQCFRHAIFGIAISGPRTRSSREFIAFRSTPGNRKIMFQKYCKNKQKSMEFYEKYVSGKRFVFVLSMFAERVFRFSIM